jgi:hypothetical protein
MQVVMHPTGAESWSAEYRERSVAILHRHGRMHVPGTMSCSITSSLNALAWLVQRIDQGVPARLN